MSITEAAAIKAVEDGLAGRSVPIVHEEIRVVLAMALRAETAERDLDTARGLIARLSDYDALASLNALLAHERARVAELEAELAAARRVIETGGQLISHEARALKAERDAARLREALERLIEDVACLPVDFCDEDEAREAEEVLVRARAALASAPSAEPEGPDYSGLCSAPECGGHCGYTHAVGCEAIREYLAEHGGAPYKAPARTAHLAPSAEPTVTP